ncbi:MAG: hypothetical protein SGBAC_007649 [Bacillariaceae sp.]
MAEDNTDDILTTTRRPRQSLVQRPSVTANDFANVIQRPSLVSAIEGSLRDINGALDELTGTPGRGGRGKSGWRPSMKKQVSNKLGINLMDEMDGIGEDQAYDYSERDGDDDDSDLSACLDGESLGLLQAELDGAASEYSQGASRDSNPSVIAGDMDSFNLEEMNDDPSEGHNPNNFIETGDKPTRGKTEPMGGEETAATSGTGSVAAGDTVPPEIRINSPMPPSKSIRPLNETEKENAENSQTKKEENVSDQEYEIRIQQVKYRALQEKMVASQAESVRMMQEQSQELESEKKAKSVVELQLLKLQADYDMLCKEKEKLYKINKVQQKAILDLQSSHKKRWI